MTVVFWEIAQDIDTKDAQQIASCLDISDIRKVYTVNSPVDFESDKFEPIDKTDVYDFARSSTARTIIRLREGGEPLPPNLVAKLLKRHLHDLSPYSYVDGADLHRRFCLEIVERQAFGMTQGEPYYPDGSLALFHLPNRISYIMDYEEYRFYYEDNFERFYGPLPISLNIEPAKICNLKCPMCEFQKDVLAADGSSESIMDMSLYKRVIDEFAAEGRPVSIGLSYRGEPLLNPNMMEMIRYAADKKTPATLNTNATLLTKEVAEQLLDAGPGGVVFSCDGATKKSYEAMRVGADYDTVVRNIRTFIELADQHEKRPTIGIRFIRSEENWFEEEAFVNQWLDSVDCVVITLPFAFTKDGKFHLHYRGSAARVSAGPRPCRDLFSNTQVTTSGNVLGGCNFNSQELEEYLYGNMNEASMKEIWANDKMNGARLKTLHPDRSNEPVFCDHCEKVNAAMHTLNKTMTDRYFKITTSSYELYYPRASKRFYNHDSNTGKKDAAQ